jgi:hypothetical protein
MQHALSWWKTGPVCEHRYCVGEQWYNQRPDAALGISCGATADALLVGVRSRHHERARSRGQVSHIHASLHVHGQENTRCCQCSSVLHRISREARRMQRVAQAKFTSISGLVVWTTTRVLLPEKEICTREWTRKSCAFMQARAPNDADVSSHAVRSVHTISARHARHPQLPYRMARHVNSGAVLPLALC